MSEVRYSVDDARLRDVLQGEIARAGTQTALAKKLGVSLAYINDAVRGRRSISALAPRLGYRTLVVHVPDGEQPPITASEAARLIDGLRRRRLEGAAS